MPKVERLTNIEIDLKKDNIFLSIDPGKENFACRLEERKNDGTIRGIIFVKIKLGENAIMEITEFFKENEEILSETNIMIVERQMPINYRMVRVSQHCESYFMTKYPNVAIFEISPKLKAEKKITYETAIEILKKGKDQKSIDLLIEMKKSKLKIDDLCDTICQIKGFLDEIENMKNVPNGPSCFKKVSTKKKKKVSKKKEE
jgi:hypothetical protein